MVNKTQHPPMRSTRDGYGEGLIAAGERDSRVVVLTGDLTGSTKVDGFAERFPERFIQVGIAEQNMMGLAAGLALAGKVPFVSSYAAFSPGNSWNQLRVSVCFTNANVKIVGTHAGLNVGPDGATAQSLEDIATTRVLPNLTVVAPCDATQAKQATLELARLKGPAYLRLIREPSPDIVHPQQSFELGKAQALLVGRDVSIFSYGPILAECLFAAQKLEKHGILSEVINLHTIKPLDRDAILTSCRKTGRAVIVEEHQTSGGLGGAIAELLAEYQPTPVRFIGVHDHFGESGKPEQLWNKYGLTAPHIEKVVRELVESSYSGYSECYGSFKQRYSRVHPAEEDRH